MITFHPITLEDRDWITKCLSAFGSRNCEFNYGNNYIWQEVYGSRTACVEDCFCVRYEEGGETVFSYPAGADPIPALHKIIAFARETEENWCIYGLSEAQTKELEQLYPGEFECSTDRKDSDYLYTVEKLSLLAGRKLHGKRNHIARFLDHTDWQYEPITADNLADVLAMDEQWYAQFREYDEEGLTDEHSVTQKSLTMLDELGMVGGCLRLEGRIVAYTFGEILGDTMIVHVEKAFPKIQGAYPMINQQFVLHTCQELAYVNREEDLGDEGLRRAKLSYQPDMLLDKYTAVPRKGKQ